MTNERKISDTNHLSADSKTEAVERDTFKNALMTGVSVICDGTSWKIDWQQNLRILQNGRSG